MPPLPHIPSLDSFAGPLVPMKATPQPSAVPSVEAKENGFLVLSRRLNEDIVCTLDGQRLVLRVMEIRGDKVRVGLKAPRSITIHRREVLDRIEAGVPPPSQRDH